MKDTTVSRERRVDRSVKYGDASQQETKIRVNKLYIIYIAVFDVLPSYLSRLVTVIGLLVYVASTVFRTARLRKPLY
jgi:hypothetical protein